jgi:hypothetical protein
MGYEIKVTPLYVHVIYKGVVDSHDLTSIISRSGFVNSARRLKRVIFDYSQSEGTNFSEDDIRRLSLLFNLESNFTDTFVAISIPKDKEGKEQFNTCKAMIKSKSWVFEIADNLAEAIALLE